MKYVRSTALTVRIDWAAKKRLQRLTERARQRLSLLTAEAINEYLDVDEWQFAGINRAIASLDRGEEVPHQQVKDWIASWGSETERPIRKRS